MRRLLAFAGCTALGLVLMASGCNRNVIDDDDSGNDVRPIKPRIKVARTPLEAPLDGIISGRVVFEGEVPSRETVIVATHADYAHCKMGTEAETTTPTWEIGKDGGVANAVIFLKPPADKYFVLTEAARTPATKVEKIRQPHCAFIPHVLTLFPKYYDGKEYQETGQTLEIINDAPIAHNVRYEGKDGVFSGPVPPNSALAPKILTPENNPLNVSCQYHSWMSAKIWAFDNPFYAKTDAQGKFTIKNVPTGVPVTFVAWHEGKGRFVSETKTFTKGVNPEIELKIKK